MLSFRLPIRAPVTASTGGVKNGRRTEQAGEASPSAIVITVPPCSRHQFTTGCEERLSAR